jgi:hypothetical protein
MPTSRPRRHGRPDDPRDDPPLEAVLADRREEPHDLRVQDCHALLHADRLLVALDDGLGRPLAVTTGPVLEAPEPMTGVLGLGGGETGATVVGGTEPRTCATCSFGSRRLLPRRSAI